MYCQSSIVADAMQNTAFAPRLRPRIHSRIRRLLENKELLFDLMDRFGSPINLVFPQQIRENVETFQAVYKKHHLRGRIYLSSKPCKSLALYREASMEDIGIDVSSAASLETALKNGWDAARIGATGPKNPAYIDAALRHSVLINVDNFDELRQISSRCAKLNPDQKAQVTIRVADCASSCLRFMGDDDNTFGIPTAEMDDVLSFLKDHKEKIDFQGFSWHASVASDEQRIAAFENLLQLTFKATKQGLKPIQINIGGGFPIMYADSCEEWNSYVGTIKESVLGRIPCQTWNGSGLGFRLEGGALRGSPAFINHAPVYTKGEELDRWLSFRLPSFGNARFSDVVRDSLLQLCIEPGRGMLDQCGITIGRVVFTKSSPKGHKLVGLDMNRSNIHADHLKQLTEPYIVPYGNGTPNDGAEGVFYMGNLCLSYDILQYNKTYPEFLPQTGDLVTFPNTAAYMMDFTESETLMQPTARKIALIEQDGAWQWNEDSDYRRTA